MNPGLLVLSIILSDVCIGTYVLKTAVVTFCPNGQERKGKIVLCNCLRYKIYYGFRKSPHQQRYYVCV